MVYNGMDWDCPTYTSVLGGVGLYEKYGSSEKRFIGIGEVLDGGVLSPKRLLHDV